MLIRIVRMTFKEAQVNSFLENFHLHKKKIRSFEGCSHLELLRDMDHDHIFITYSYWESPEALEGYRRSELFRSVWANTKPLFAKPAMAFSMKRYIKVEGHE